MPSNNSKYSKDMREQTARHCLEKGKSATQMAEELEIDTNTVCKWVRDYMFEYIELFYNMKRIHSTLGHLSPVDYRMSKEASKTA